MEHKATIHEVGIVVGEKGMGAPAIIVAAREVLIPIFVSQDQATSVELARRNQPIGRPLTHDLFWIC